MIEVSSFVQNRSPMIVYSTATVSDALPELALTGGDLVGPGLFPDGLGALIFKKFEEIFRINSRIDRVLF